MVNNIMVTGYQTQGDNFFFDALFRLMLLPPVKFHDKIN